MKTHQRKMSGRRGKVYEIKPWTRKPESPCGCPSGIFRDNFPFHLVDVIPRLSECSCDLIGSLIDYRGSLPVEGVGSHGQRKKVGVIDL